MPLRTLPEKDFFGRKEELIELYSRSLEAEKGITQSGFLSGLRGIGKTELLKQLFNHLFWGQAKVAPFYYCVNSGILSVPDFSRDYLTHYILQRFAFEKKDSSLIGMEGLSLERLSSIAEERKSTWALDLLDRYSQSCQEPIDSIRIALSAPYQSALATGVPVVVMIDEFQRLKNLHIHGAVDHMLVALFEEPVSCRVAPHLITGSQAEIQEILFSSSALSGNLAKIDVPPLKLEDATLMFLSLQGRYGGIKSSVPDAVFEYLGGNPFYIKCMAKAVRFKKSREIGEKDFWTAYLEEISGGNIYLYWASILKSFFPEVSLRRKALEILNKINSAGESLTSARISRSFSLSGEQTEGIMKALYLSGFVTGEFGVFRIPKDRGLRDFIDCLCMREILEKSYRDFETKFLERSASIKDKGVSFEMT
ncbi:MAG: ATP-binding protein, partial [Nitrospirae bacterium]|nr:ATP-binding protein [Nitrospirota bacterium]